jgi:hypothetical protein
VPRISPFTEVIEDLLGEARSLRKDAKKANPIKPGFQRLDHNAQAARQLQQMTKAEREAYMQTHSQAEILNILRGNQRNGNG